jgi:hypothetical protein
VRETYDTDGAPRRRRSRAGSDSGGCSPASPRALFASVLVSSLASMVLVLVGAVLSTDGEGGGVREAISSPVVWSLPASVTLCVHWEERVRSCDASLGTTRRLGTAAGSIKFIVSSAGLDQEFGTKICVLPQ